MVAPSEESMSSIQKTQVLGIDPAPSKVTWICTDDQTFIKRSALDLADYLEQALRTHKNTLIAWDAPLSFDPTLSLSDRPIDKMIRKALQTALGYPRNKGSISVLPFTGCPHWAISCHVLGHPVGPTKHGLRLVDAPGPGPRLVEVHPAVALGIWWSQLKGPGELLPKYKGLTKSKTLDTLRDIADVLAPLQPPKEVRESDDHLDAWVAWKLGHDLLHGKAELVSDVRTGGYVLPLGARELLQLPAHLKL